MKAGRLAASEREPPHLIGPFGSFRNLPDQQEFFDGRPDRHILRYQYHAGRWAVRHEIRKMLRHCPAIMGDDHPTPRRRQFEHPGVSHFLRDYALWQFKIDLWRAPQKTRHDLLIEIGVSEEADLQARVAECCRAAPSRAVRASGKWVSLVFTSAQSRS